MRSRIQYVHFRFTLSTQAYVANVKKNIYLDKLFLDNNLHFWPAGDPLICSTCCCLACGGPDQGCVGAVGVVAVGVAPRVDKVVGRCVGKNHGGFGFEVTFGGWAKTVLVGSEERIEKDLSS